MDVHRFSFFVKPEVFQETKIIYLEIEVGSLRWLCLNVSIYFFRSTNLFSFFDSLFINMNKLQNIKIRSPYFMVELII